MPKKTYKIGEDIYDIEESDVSSFLKQAPNAKEVKSFLIGKDTFDVEIPDVDAFLKQVPDAKPLFDEVKKKRTSNTCRWAAIWWEKQRTFITAYFKHCFPISFKKTEKYYSIRIYRRKK